MPTASREPARTLTDAASGNELVIRDNRSLWIGIVIVALGTMHFYLHSHAALGVICAGVLGAMYLSEYVIFPRCIRVRPSGVVVSHFGNTTEYPWSAIRAFEIGNPAIPNDAYLVRDAPRAQAVLLPRFQCITPSDLVSLLEERRKAHTKARNAA